MVEKADGAAPVRRGVGKRAGLSLDRIVDTAKALDAHGLTIQAVADELGVDRKAVRHYVGDVGTLLGLVALDAFSAGSVDADIPYDATWQQACRLFARRLADSIIATDTLAEHLRPDDAVFDRFGPTTEALLRKLLEAGMDDEGALRTVALLSNICFGFARDALVVAAGGQRPRRQIAGETLRNHETELPVFARIVAMDIDTYDRKQLEVSIDIVVAGLERTLLD